MDKPVIAAEVSEIPIGKVKSFEAGGERIAVFHTENGFFAVEDRCSHADVLLSEGWLEGDCVCCPWHGAQFDLLTGEALSGPAVASVRIYSVLVDKERVFISDPGA